MSRLRADLILVLVSIIWGTTFIAQKNGMDGIGAFGFVGARFTLSFFLILPLALREIRKDGEGFKRNKPSCLLLCLPLMFSVAVLLQQMGMMSMTATDGGFLTSLYVIVIPFAAWFLFKRMPQFFIWPACILALLGMWLLNNATLAFGIGDGFLLGCAFVFGIQVALLGYVVQTWRFPLTLSVLQYGACALLGLWGAFMWEDITWIAIMNNLPEILYAGVMSGGVAYTLQAVAQQHTPPSDAGIIMAAEAPVAAVAAFFLLGERLNSIELTGCFLILAAILLVEAGAFIFTKRAKTV